MEEDSIRSPAALFRIRSLGTMPLQVISTTEEEKAVCEQPRQFQSVCYAPFRVSYAGAYYLDGTSVSFTFLSEEVALAMGACGAALPFVIVYA
ncbi:hypothetical protein V6N11_003952 [Hibiscus sabdariffa]|uniref:Uncharacterized protein n=1 Tax=Hibiscus sabdariffa TaxID=183260 RepID=A0ABR2SFI7_9ROSI